jgi:hypothetical protein
VTAGPRDRAGVVTTTILAMLGDELRRGLLSDAELRSRVEAIVRDELADAVRAAQGDLAAPES